MSEGQIALFIPILALLIPVFAIVGGIATKVMRDLAEHQRKMAELLHGRSSAGDQMVLEEIRALRGEVADLRDRVNQVALNSDVRPSLNN
ncbi:MAG: hypothetical protein KIT11_00190 [Fimbriimonadaceae bacterium]|nr:hypothetical protein [Fimbriimonadaceae bacterium]QYK55207.1 MAG: hypothetical protein KF733_09345 [Fimbriimonadaceae bacterium]